MGTKIDYKQLNRGNKQPMTRNELDKIKETKGEKGKLNQECE